VPTITATREYKKLALPYNPETLNRTFTSNVARGGLDVEHIMKLGG